MAHYLIMFVCLLLFNISSFSQALPTSPVCTANVTDTYVEITCTTESFYPYLNGVLYRREAKLTTKDTAAGYPICYLSLMYGDTYNGFCKWRIPMNRMLAVSTFYVKMTTNISDVSTVDRHSSTSSNLTVTLQPPEVVVHKSNCPVGPGAVQQSVLFGSYATCKCELTSQQYPDVHARWYTTDNRQVGTDNSADRSSTITVSYNSSDPNQSYECRLVSSSVKSASVVTYSPTFTTENCTLLATKNTTIVITSIIPTNVTYITWQLISGATYINLSTCDVLRRNCSDTMPVQYRGLVGNLPVNNSILLAVMYSRVNETQFAFLTDDGRRIYTCPLGIYVEPNFPTCNKTLTVDYVDITCTTNKVYPRARARLHRGAYYMTQDDFEPGYPQCTLSDRLDGDYSQTCVWRIPMNKMVPDSWILAIVEAILPDGTIATRIPRMSETIHIELNVPSVQVSTRSCPVGPGVRRGTIRIGTNATCACQLVTDGFPPASAHWYNQHNEAVGDYNSQSLTATLTVSYDSSDPNQFYECRPITPLITEVVPVRYTPKFSSAPRNSVFELHSLIIVLGSVWTGVLSRLM